MTHDPMKSAAADAAATAAAYSARNTYALGWEAGARASRLEEGTEYQHLQETLDAAESRIAVEASRAEVAVRHLESCEDILRAVKRERDAEKSRADVAEQRVCELRDQLHGWPCCKCGHPSCNHCRDDADVAETLASTADIAGRWVSMTDFERSRARRLVAMAQRDAAIARAETSDAAARSLGADFTRVLRECGESERARDEVGIQYAAAQAEIARMQPVVDAARLGIAVLDRDQRIYDALRALDTVPGDALPHGGLASSGRLEALLEASGIDTANVKGGE